MVEFVEKVGVAESEFLEDKLVDLDDDDSIFSSDSEFDDYYFIPTTTNRLFGRQKPLHIVFGAGKSADILLWRNKQISASIFAGATVTWVLFEWIGYHFLTFVCHFLMLSFATLFLWSYLASFIDISPPELPEILLPEGQLASTALSLRSKCNWVLRTLRDVASGTDLKKFLSAVLALWILSVVGSWFSLLTLFCLVIVILLTLPALYERNEDSVDTFAERALVELKQQYTVMDEQFLQKIPTLILSRIKQHQS